MTTPDLWGAAYEQIQKEDPKLLAAYKKYLLAPNNNSTFYPADTTIMALGYPCLKNKWLSPSRFLTISVLHS